MQRYTGKTALVTGAASGIGRAAAVRLASEGAHVLGLDRDEAGLDATVTAVRNGGGQAEPVLADVTDAAHVGTTVTGMAVDVLVHAAGVATMSRTDSVRHEDWSRVLEINLTGMFNLIQATLPGLRRRRGAVVAIASIAALGGRPYLAAYSAAKGGVVALTRSLAVEYAHDGIRFCCVCPGSVDTPLRSGLRPPPDTDQALLARGGSLLEQKAATPADIAAAVAYLGSDEARFATGTVLTLDGGALA